jgi:hypothetical protein
MILELVAAWAKLVCEAYLVSGLVETHIHHFVLSSTIYVFWNLVSSSIRVGVCLLLPAQHPQFIYWTLFEYSMHHWLKYGNCYKFSHVHTNEINIMKLKCILLFLKDTVRINAMQYNNIRSIGTHFSLLIITPKCKYVFIENWLLEQYKDNISKNINVTTIVHQHFFFLNTLLAQWEKSHFFVTSSPGLP